MDHRTAGSEEMQQTTRQHPGQLPHRPVATSVHEQLIFLFHVASQFELPLQQRVVTMIDVFFGKQQGRPNTAASISLPPPIIALLRVVSKRSRNVL
jgi:hypothetical protein